MWWWRLIVFAESARRRWLRRHRNLLLLSIKNSCLDYFYIFAVCSLALGNPPAFNFFFSVSPTKSMMDAKIIVTLESLSCFMELFHDGLTKRLHPGRVLISFWRHSDIKNFFLRFRILAHISVLLILAIIKI